mmetsp:Transcript_42240/g.75773  ORF Transcript_42240/g.75773 Transcript_42240/m.75773 type:complete len:452 (-) Transcript_42240:420-1775(-)
MARVLPSRRLSAPEVLASSGTREWKELSKDLQRDVAMDLFRQVENGGRDCADKTALYNALVHGSVAVPQSKVQALFETLDVHDNGRVSASEWVENFQRYITEVSERRQAHHIPAEKNTVKATGSSGRPGTPSMMPYGVRGTASERTLRNTGATVAGKSASNSAKELRRSVRLSVSCSVDGGSDSDSHSSQSSTPKSTTNSPKVAASALTRRLSNVTPAAAGVGLPARRQSDRSVVTKKPAKNTHFVVGHTGLNQRANHDAFKAKLIRRKSLKALLAVFSGISIREDGTVARREFECYMRRNAPDLVQFAQSIYKAVAAKSKTHVADGDEELLDFPALLRVMYPGATEEDIRELIKLTQPREVALHLDGKVEEAKGLFDQYNWSANGWLTPQQFVDGMYIIGMTEEDVDQHYEELFPEDKIITPVNFRTFFAWYSGHELPDKFAHMSKESMA